MSRPKGTQYELAKKINRKLFTVRGRERLPTTTLKFLIGYPVGSDATPNEKRRFSRALSEALEMDDVWTLTGKTLTKIRANTNGDIKITDGDNKPVEGDIIVSEGDIKNAELPADDDEF